MLITNTHIQKHKFKRYSSFLLVHTPWFRIKSIIYRIIEVYKRILSLHSKNCKGFLFTSVFTGFAIFLMDLISVVSNFFSESNLCVEFTLSVEIKVLTK